MSEDLDMRRRRASYRAAHRGTKEMDFLLSRYAQVHLDQMDEEELERFEQLLALPDPQLQTWCMAAELPADAAFADLISRLRTFHGLK